MKKLMKMVCFTFIMALCAMTIQPASVSAATPTSAQLKTKVKAVVSQNTTSSMTKSQKMKVLFKLVEKSYGYKPENRPTAKNWYKTYAYNFLKNKKGSCYGYAAAYGYLLKQATGYQVRVVIGATKAFSGVLQYHAWTEAKINGAWYVFDTNLDKNVKGGNCKLKYYNKKHDSSAMKKTYSYYDKDYTKYYTIAY